jgi:hypothetical protein
LRLKLKLRGFQEESGLLALLGFDSRASGSEAVGEGEEEAMLSPSPVLMSCDMC